jgi:hypothetical protein
MRVVNYKELKKLIYFVPQQLDVSKQIAALRHILEVLRSGSKVLSDSQREYHNLYNSIKSEGIKEPIKFTEFSRDSIILVDGKHRCAISIELQLDNIIIDFVDPLESIFSKNISSDVIKNIHKEIFHENCNN